MTTLLGARGETEKEILETLQLKNSNIPVDYQALMESMEFQIPDVDTMPVNNF